MPSNDKIRIRNSDGTINVHCRRCGFFITRMTFAGVYSATCVYCDRNIERPKEDSMQEELLQEIFASTNSNESVETQSKPKKKFSLLDMALGTFKALGFKRKVPVEPTEEVQYQSSDPESSKEIARRKKSERTPIFGGKKQR